MLLLAALFMLAIEEEEIAFIFFIFFIFWLFSGV